MYKDLTYIILSVTRETKIGKPRAWGLEKELQMMSAEAQAKEDGKEATEPRSLSMSFLLLSLELHVILTCPSGYHINSASLISL